MRAVAYRTCLPVEDPQCLIDVELPDPVAHGSDLLVEVRAVAVNPVDTKVRRNLPPPSGGLRVPGWDAAGVVRAVGSDVTRFRPGDRVMYAGALDRPGSNAELQLVDERLVGPMPKSLGFTAAAALPLTMLTAWELLFDRLQVVPGPNTQGVLLVTGAAGGVGSALLQLARQLTGLTVVGTASRQETRDWAIDMGAHHVVDHAEQRSGRTLVDQVRALGIGQVEYIASLTHTDIHFPALAELVAPQGRLALIDDPAALDIRLLKRKSASLHWEFMFTRSLFNTPDVGRQGEILSEVAQQVDAGQLRSTMNLHYGAICAADLRRAHAEMERHRACGKIVLDHSLHK